jgi:O-acetylhomoserine (thiol)-lyase
VGSELSELFGPIAMVLRARAALLRDLGPSLSPQNAFQLLQGLETLPLRIRRQFDNAAKVADLVAAHPKVAKRHHRRHRPRARRWLNTRRDGIP